MKKALKDPLIHFLILGGLLFAFVSVLGGNDTAQNEIVITKTTQKHLADLFEITWQRKPTEDELKNLTQEHIKEEIYYREALALGLDENDTIVRRRMRQKLEFMQEDLSSLKPPTETELEAYYDAHKDKYKTDHIISLIQIIVSSKRLDAGAIEIRRAREVLDKGVQPSTLSRSSLLPVAMNLESKKSITNTFGSDFTKQVVKLANQEIGKWAAPVYSGFGTHLVKINLNQKPKPLTFDQVRNKVLVDYTQTLREEAAANYYKNLREQYRISIESTE